MDTAGDRSVDVLTGRKWYDLFSDIDAMMVDLEVNIDKT
jgi:hypothetical protein